MTPPGLKERAGKNGEPFPAKKIPVIGREKPLTPKPNLESASPIKRPPSRKF